MAISRKLLDEGETVIVDARTHVEALDVVTLVGRVHLHDPASGT